MPKLVFRAGMLHLEASADLDPEADLGLKDWLWDQRSGRWSAFAVGYPAFRDAARQAGFQVDDQVGRSWPEVTLSSEGALELRPYQREAVHAWEGFGRRGLVTAGQTRSTSGRSSWPTTSPLPLTLFCDHEPSPRILALGRTAP